MVAVKGSNRDLARHFSGVDRYADRYEEGHASGWANEPAVSSLPRLPSPPHSPPNRETFPETGNGGNGYF